MGALACGGVLAADLTFHVAPAGADTAAGTAAAPFATLARARDAIRSLKREGRGLPGPVTVLVRGGVYPLEQALQFTPEDSGTATTPITYQAYPGERPVLSGGRTVGGWRRYDERLWVAEVPWAKELTGPLCQLFVNGVRRPRARTPNAGEYLYSRRLLLTPDEYPQCLGLVAEPGALRPWANPDEAVICLFHNWVNSYNRVKQADWERGRFTFARPAGIFFLGPQVRYYVENTFDALDQPGEWFLDRSKAALFYFPVEGEDMSRVEVIAPRLRQTLVSVRGELDLGLYVEYLVFRGLSFQHADADLAPDYVHSVQGANTQRGAFAATAMRHSLIEDCEFTRLGEHAVFLREACAWNTVRRCHVHDVGGGGVYLSEGAPATPAERILTLHNTVDSNFIHDGGLIFRAACGVFLGGSASYNEITHNEICDLSWMGVHAGWSWTGKAPAYTHHNTIAYNHIHHIGNGVLNDIGGIYTLGVSPGTVLHHNQIHDISRFEQGKLGYGGWGIYLDAGSSEIRVEDNVVYNTRDGGLHVHNYGYPYGNLVVNNIFAYAQDGQLIRNANHEPETNHVHLERNLVYNEKPPLLGGNNWKPDSKFTSDRNCFWSESGQPEFDGRSFAAWQQTGRDTNSIVADPRFVNPRERDFRLQPDSPALALGFRPIDLSAVGLQGSDEWRQLPQGIRHRAFEAAPPGADPWPLREGFEDYDVGDRPPGVVPDEGGARALVTDAQAASGRQCLRFEDAPGVTPWKPHWCVWFEPRPDTLRVRCSVRNDPAQPATIELELRDWPPSAGVIYSTGPHLRLLPDGSVQVPAADAGWTTVGAYPLDRWLQIEIGVAPGGQNPPGTWSLRLSGPEGTLVAREGLPWRRATFTSCTWFGIVGADAKQAAFFVDDILIE
jgi:hypothetical protein